MRFALENSLHSALSIIIFPIVGDTIGRGFVLKIIIEYKGVDVAERLDYTPL
jgi:hypothetical protein